MKVGAAAQPGERGHSPLHRPARFSGFLVSMECTKPGSTRTMGRSERRGMAVAAAPSRAGEERSVGIASMGIGGPHRLSRAASRSAAGDGTHRRAADWAQQQAGGV